MRRVPAHDSDPCHAFRVFLHPMREQDDVVWNVRIKTWEECLKGKEMRGCAFCWLRTVDPLGRLLRLCQATNHGFKFQNTPPHRRRGWFFTQANCGGSKKGRKETDSSSERDHVLRLELTLDNICEHLAEAGGLLRAHVFSSA